jgi:hypothetical protein
VFSPVSWQGCLMGSKKITPAQRARFFRLLERGMNGPEASAQVGISRQSGWRLMRGLDAMYPMAKGIAESERRDENQPDPKPFTELSTDAQAALTDFNTFGRLFLARREVPWRAQASLRVVDALQDRSERSYLVLSCPPGSGKTTLMADLCLWLIAGFGSGDPQRGRAVRIMIGAFGLSVSKHMVGRLRRVLESASHYYDKTSGLTAPLSLVGEYGRFRPRQEGAAWRADELVVEQMVGTDVVEKEPTLQAASRESGFLGERVDLAVWDDLVTSANIRTPDARSDLATWFSMEAESRIEPGGALALVGQRMGPADLYRDRLDMTYTDDDDVRHRKYQSVRFPAHHDDLCDANAGGSHRQWDGVADGCLLDALRLPWRELQAEQQANQRRYRLLYQQQDVDPAGALVDIAWIEGGTDHDGFESPGCYDNDRALGEYPAGVSGLVDFVSVDPSAGGFWGILHLAYQPETKATYLINGLRSSRFKAGDLLDFKQERGELDGIMQTWTTESVRVGHPIRCWLLESNSAFKTLTERDAYREWKRVHRNVGFLQHVTTGWNKNSVTIGVEGLLPSLFRQGLIRIPHKPANLDGLHFLRAFVKEATEYPESATNDLIMAFWMGMVNLPRILMTTRRTTDEVDVKELKLPPYLVRQRIEVATS